MTVTLTGAQQSAEIARVVQHPAYSAVRAAGLSSRQAWRWVAYVELKARRGERPIPLDEAVRQCTAAADPMTRTSERNEG